MVLLSRRVEPEKEAESPGRPRAGVNAPDVLGAINSACEGACREVEQSRCDELGECDNTSPVSRRSVATKRLARIRDLYGWLLNGS